MPAVTEPPSMLAAPASLEARLLASLRDSMGLDEQRRVRVDAGYPSASRSRTTRRSSLPVAVRGSGSALSTKRRGSL